MKKSLNNMISSRQLRALLYVALLPAAANSSSSASKLAGSAGWLAPLAGLLVILAAALPTLPLLNGRAEGEGLIEVTAGLVGKPAAKALACVYALWLACLGGIALRHHGERFAISPFRSSPVWIFVIIMAVFVVLVLYGRFSHLARASQIFLAFQLLLMLMVVVFSLKNVSTDYLLPVTAADAPKIFGGGLRFADNMAAGLAAAFLAGSVKKDRRNKRMLASCAALLGVSGAALLLVIIGSFSSELAAHMTRPALALVKNLTLFRALTRIDAVMVALWVFNELCFLTLTGFASAHLLAFVFGVRERKRLAIPIAIFASAVALVFPDIFDMDKIAEKFSLPISAILCLGVPLCLYVVQLIKNSKKSKKVEKSA